MQAANTRSSAVRLAYLYSRKFTFMLSAGVLYCAMTPASALTIHYDETRSEALRSCDNLRYRGDDSGADECFTRLLELEPGNDLDKAASAAALGDVQEANRRYRDLAAGSSDPAIKTHWAGLYLRTHQISDAEGLFREALLYDNNWLPARLGLAQSLAEGFEGRAREQLDSILTEHPDNVHGLVLSARIELELQNVDKARELLDRALEAADGKIYWKPNR